jgi:TRAP-type C4-dicarboxylate transport system substrate-binding protein
MTNSKHPIAKLEDFRGLKIRVLQLPLYVDMFNALGSNAVPMAYPELYSALENKAVDGQENTFSSIETAKFYEVQKHVSTTRHVYQPLILLFSKKIWDQLSADEQRSCSKRRPRRSLMRARYRARRTRSRSKHSGARALS